MYSFFIPMLNLWKIFRKSQGFTIPNFISKIEDKKYEVFMHARLLEVLYVKSKKKTQVQNCPGAEMSHPGADLSSFPFFFFIHYVIYETVVLFQ